MTEMITGYQWGDDGHYIGVYEFPNNLDKEEIALPPRTTLLAPPVVTEPFKEAAWDGTQWIVRDEVLTWVDVGTLQAMYLAGAITADQIIKGFPA